MRFFIPLLLVVSSSFGVSCNQTPTPVLTPSEQLQERVALLEARNGANPTPENRAELMAVYEEQSQDENLSQTQRLDRIRYISEALYVAGKHDQAFNRLRRGIADFKDAGSLLDASLFLAELAIQRRQEPETAELIFAALRTRFPNAQGLTKIPKEYEYITLPEAKQILQQEVYPKTGFSREAAIRYGKAAWAITAIEADSQVVIEDHLAAGRVLEQAKSYTAALEHYDEVINRYPDSSRAGDAMMLKAVVLQDVYQKNGEAKQVVNQMLAAHPDHDLADDAKALLATMQ